MRRFYLADRLILMTDGPEATVGDVLQVPFPRPRSRAAVLAHPQYHACRRHVIDFLEHHAHQSRPSAWDDPWHNRSGVTHFDAAADGPWRVVLLSPVVGPPLESIDRLIVVEGICGGQTPERNVASHT